MLEHFCEVLTASLLSREALDLREHTTQSKEGCVARRERRVDREEGGLRALNATFGKKAKHKLEWACKGGGWLTVLPISQDGTDLSREEIRYAFWWRLDTPLQTPPPGM